MPQVHPHHKAHPARRFSVSLASLCAAILSVVGVYAVTGSHAAVQQLYLSPANSSVLKDNTFTEAVYLNTGGESVNAVQANLTYNPSQLQYVSYSNAGGVLPLDAADSTPSGNLQFTRSTSGGGQPVTGTGLIVTVTFKALVGSGTAAITFGSGSSALRSSDSSNIVTATGSSSIALTSPATPTPAPVVTRTPTPVPTATPVPSSGSTHTSTPTPAAAGSKTTPAPTPGVTAPAATPVPPAAAGTAQLYLDPSSGSIAKGTSLKVGVRLKTAVPINAVQATLNYSKNLTFGSISGDGSALPLSAQSNGGNGTVTVVRSTQGGGTPVTGDILVATISFIANDDSGTAAISFAGSSAALAASNSANVLSAPSGGTYSLISSGGSGSSSTPIPAPAAVAGVTPIVLPESGAGDPVSVNGTIQLSADPSTDGTITSYEVDGHKVGSGKIDTTYLSNGTHTITAIVTKPNGERQTITQPISVNNKLNTWQKSRNTVVAAFGGRPGVALGAVITLVVLLVAAGGFLIVWPHLQAASMENRLLHHTAAVPASGFPQPAMVMPAGSEPVTPEPVVIPPVSEIVTPAIVMPEAPVVEPSAEVSEPVIQPAAGPAVTEVTTDLPVEVSTPTPEAEVTSVEPVAPAESPSVDGIKPPTDKTPPTA